MPTKSLEKAPRPQELPEELKEFAEEAKERTLQTIYDAECPPKNTYVRISHEDPALVTAIEKYYRKRVDHSYCCVFFRGESIIGRLFDTIIIPLCKLGDVRDKDNLHSDWTTPNCFEVMGLYSLHVEGTGRLGGLLVAFERERPGEQDEMKSI